MNIREVKTLYIRSCLSKRNLTKEEADKCIDKFSLNRKVLYYYKCTLCSSYHLTKRVPNNTQELLEVA